MKPRNAMFFLFSFTLAACTTTSPSQKYGVASSHVATMEATSPEVRDMLTEKAAERIEDLVWGVKVIDHGDWNSYLKYDITCRKNGSLGEVSPDSHYVGRTTRIYGDIDIVFFPHGTSNGIFALEGIRYRTRGKDLPQVLEALGVLGYQIR